MPESVGEAAARRRANRVGLRTLRQRPRIVGHTAAGLPIYEVRSVRLLLLGDANHFSRLEQCARCGRNSGGAPVLKPDDLDQPTQAMLCRDCNSWADSLLPTMDAAAAGPEPPEPPDEPEPPEPPEPPDEPEAPDEPEPPAPEPEPVAAVPADGGRTAPAEAVEAVEARLHASLVAGLSQIRTAVGDALQAGTARTTELEGHVRRVGTEVAQILRGQRGELAALSDALAETRAELHRRIDAMEAREATPAAEPLIEEALAGLARSVQAHRTEVHATVSAGFSEAVAQVTALEQQLHDRVAVLTRVVQELVEAGRLAEGRLQALEQGIQASRDRLAQPVETRRGDLVGDIERELDAAQQRLADVFGSGRAAG